MPAWLALTALRAFAGRALKWLGSLNGWQLLALALSVVLMIDHAALIFSHRHSVKLETQIVKCTSARHADQLAYATAQAAAQAKNLADVARIEHQQQEVSDETVALLNSDIARLRRELRSPAPQSHPAGPGVSPSGQGPAGAPGEARMCLSSEELLRAAENEERHDRLIDWVERQSQVRR